MGCWGELEVAFNPGRFLSGGLVTGRALQRCGSLRDVDLVDLSSAGQGSSD